MKVTFLNNKKQKLSGIYKKGKKKELIIFCHAYGINKDYPAIKQIAETLEKEGYSTLRFDFTGVNESEGVLDDIVEQEVNDVLSAIKHFKDYKKVILIGGSIGALVASITSLKSKKVCKLISINGFFGLPLLSPKFIKPYFKFVCDLHDDTYYIKNFRPGSIKIPVLVIYSKADKDVSQLQSKMFFSKLKCEKTLKILDKGDHYLSRKSYIDDTINLIEEWLN